ncbi:MAG: Fe(3+)-hydroxamate ABC transporter permease FhuB [Propionibacteriales bacterium]|nr:Fe(3+)-hydroxamate ABC transporter permease FhuB [Propionibacteriales bacterium]
MTQVDTPAPPGLTEAPAAVRRTRVATVFTSATVAIVLLAGVHLTQGTSEVAARDLLRLATGDVDENAWNVLVASRLPRMLAGLVVGAALGVAGATLQSVARNPLASPDTLGVNAGAHLAITTVAALGVTLPTLFSGLFAFVGGLAAAALVMMLSAGNASGPTRLILAGSATAMALNSLTMLLLLLFEQNTLGLFAWGSGSLVQSDLDGVRQMAPVVLVAVVACVAIGHRLDILVLGDDTATSLGLDVRRTRLVAVLLAVLLSSAAVTLAGPIGFVGLCAPVIVRLVAPLVPELHRHHLLVPLSGITGVLIVLGADVLLRGSLGGQAGVEVPTGVVTTVLGAGILVWLARRHRDSGPTRQPPAAQPARARSRAVFVVTLTICGILVVGAVVAGMLLGDTLVLTGDVANWVRGDAGLRIGFVLDQRLPRVTGALLAGTALALAGVTVQSVCRNPLAEPGLLGISAGAGVGAVTLITFVPLASGWTMTAVACAAALVTFGLVYGLSWRGGLDSDRLVLIGIGFWSGLTAVSTFVIVSVDPWNTGKALTWLSGSTYGRTMDQVLPVLVALVALTPVVALARRELDLLALDDDTPRVLGVPLERTRLVALGGAAVLASTAVSAVGVVGFVGLVAPHAARALVGSRHRRVIPVAMLLGAILVSVADTIGRTVIAPAQVPAGLLTALIGTPYFVWLLWRSRA